MDNSRQIEDRLKKIIKEVSIYTGGEIKNQVVEDFAKAVSNITNQNHHKYTLTLMAMLKKSLDKL